MNLFNQYTQAAHNIGLVMQSKTQDVSEIKLLKQYIQESYTTFGLIYPPRIFLNLGLWNKKINKEFNELNFPWTTLSDSSDNNSFLLLYYLIRPLIKQQVFHKRLLDIGCGNGLGLRMSSEMLHADYALGVDLVNRLITNAKNNFYKKDKRNYIQSDAELLPLENNSFDIITSLESSHIYPKIEHFFFEVERILSLGGYFCYADHNFKCKEQANKFETFVQRSNKLKIIQKVNITKLVQASLYQRWIVREDEFFRYAQSIISPEADRLEQLCTFVAVCGLIFLPWWKIKFKNQELKEVARYARKEKFWGKKYYFYYLVQKINN